MIVLMLFWFLSYEYDTCMKKMIVVCFSIIIEFLSCALCYATISPVEGSSNYLDTDTGVLTPVDCVDIEFVFARGSGAEYKTSDMWLKYKSEMTKLSKKAGLFLSYNRC